MPRDSHDRIWKALADPMRRTILDCLRDGPRQTSDLCAQFTVSRFAVMKHLNVLADAGLITIRREGRARWNYLNPTPLQEIYERWMTPYMALWSHELLDLKQTVEHREAKRKERKHGQAQHDSTTRV